MTILGPHGMLVDFHETIVGLRTGQTGRANAFFVQLLDRLSPQLENLTSASQQRAVTVIGAMLAAKDRDDGIALADILQYELPALLDETASNPGLCDCEIIARLRSLHALTDRTGDIDAAARGLRDIYHRHPSLNGLGAFIAGPFYRNGHYAAARRLLEVDEQEKRHTPQSAFILSLAIAREGDFAQATSLMQWAYDRSNILRDGHAQLGWMKAEERDWQGALELAQLDEQLTRLTPEWQVNLAQLYGRLDDFEHACALIQQAYARNSELKDGFARLGKISTEANRFQDALEFTKRDEAAGRLSPEALINLAHLHGRMQQFAKAEVLIASAYSLNPELRDAYAKLGWMYAGEKNWLDAKRCMLIDRSLNRLGPEYQVNLAQIYGRMNDYVTAAELIDDAYSQDNTLQNAYTRLARIKVEAGLFDDAFRLLRKDQQHRRLDDEWTAYLDSIDSDASPADALAQRFAQTQRISTRKATALAA
jgi:thioredoxin-like negative regulator of GroEL